MAAILSESEKHLIEVCSNIIESKFNDLKTELDKSFDKRDVDLCTKLTNEVEEKVNDLQTFVSRMPNTSVPGTEQTGDPAKDFSFAKIANAQMSNDWSGAGYELEVRKTMIENGVYQKAQTLGTAADGGYIVPEEQAESVIDRLRAGSVVFGLGARSLDGLDRSPYTFPRLTGSVTAAWGAEAASITATDATFDEVTLAIKELRSLNIYSNMLLRTSHPSIEAVIRDDMAKQFAEAIDSAALQGPGTGGAPTGIANQSGVNTQAVGTSITYDELQGFIAALRVDDALKGKLGWAMAPESFNNIMTMRDATSGSSPDVVNTQPLARRVLSEGALDKLLGYPFATTSQLPATVGAADTIIFGNFDDVWIGRWGTLEIMASQHHAFSTNQGALRGVMYADVAVRHPTSFCVAT